MLQCVSDQCIILRSVAVYSIRNGLQLIAFTQQRYSEITIACKDFSVLGFVCHFVHLPPVEDEGRLTLKYYHKVETAPSDPAGAVNGEMTYPF